MTAAEYKSERKLRGTQSEIAVRLGVRQATISDRETGAMLITQEAWLALLSIPKKRKKKNEPAE